MLNTINFRNQCLRNGFATYFPPLVVTLFTELQIQDYPSNDD
jgi:hypothetical protein